MSAYKKIEIGVSNKEIEALEDLLYAELTPIQQQQYTAIIKKLWLRLVTKFDKQQPKKPGTVRNKTHQKK